MRLPAVFLVAAAGAFFLEAQGSEWFFPAQLRCNFLRNPQAVPRERITFSWTCEGSGRDRRQTAYRIVVASTAVRLVGSAPYLWDSGKVRSPRQVGIPYAGAVPPLGTQLWWRVRLWDERNRPSPWSEPAYFRVGPSSGEEFGGLWIGAPGAAAPPLRDHNGYHSAFTRSAVAPGWVTIDLAEQVRMDGVRLHPCRPFDWEPPLPGFLFPVRFRVDVAAEASFSEYRTVVDCTRSDVPNPRSAPLTFRFEPTEGRFVRLVVTQRTFRTGAGYAFALAELEVLRGEESLALGALVRARASIEQGGWSKRYLTDGLTVSQKARIGAPKPCPLLRKRFHLSRGVRSALLYATALGLYKLRLNGTPVGDCELAPEMTHYLRRVQYQVFDVTALLRKGENVLGVILGSGWYAGRVGLSQIVPRGPLRGIYGLKPRFRCRLVVHFRDGRKKVIASDTTWRVWTDGPIRRSCLLDGEVYDARKELPGWDCAGFDDAAWAPAQVVPRIAVAVVPQVNEPIRVVRTVAPVAVTEVRPWVFIADMGQNLAGRVKITVNEKPGTRIRMRHAEMLSEDGTLYRANLRMPRNGGPLGARQEDVYMCRGGGPETFEPHFTYHGFRYVEITGLSRRPAPLDLSARVLASDVAPAGSFHSSSELLNRLMEAIRWTIQSNLHGMPTDCPQRDERLGWMGDAQVICQTACFFFHMAAFLNKWIVDIEDCQAPDGRFPDFAPHPYDPQTRFSGTPCWADAGVLVPWCAFVNYADKGLLARHYDSMCRWIEYVRIHSPGLLWTEAWGNNYGDWLNGDRVKDPPWQPGGCSIPSEVLASAFFARTTRVCAEAARVLGRREDAHAYGELSHHIKKAFWRAYASGTGRIKGDTQAGYALALAFELVPPALRDVVCRHLVERIAQRDFHLTTGIQTTVRALEALSGCGGTQHAYRLVRERRFPSWGYMLEHGATTIWERWDGFVEGRGFQDPGMNSFNHYAFGSVGEWVWRHVVGLAPDPASPGWQRFAVRPEPGGRLSYVSAEYRSLRGPIRVSWRIGASRFLLAVTIPANCTAEVHVPRRGEGPVRESGVDLGAGAGTRLPPGIHKVLSEDRREVVCSVGSGMYLFTSPWESETTGGPQ